MNKSTREIQNLNRKAAQKRKDGNNDVFAIHTQHGADPKNAKKHVVTVVRAEHGPRSFMEPAEAMKYKREHGIRTWRAEKREKNS